MRSRPVAVRIALLILLTIPQEASGQVPLTDRGLANTTAFTRLLGYVRFFHPTELAFTLNWDSVTVHGMRRVERAPAADSLARTLRDIFAPIAPDVQIFPADRDERARTVTIPRNGGAPIGVMHWRHHGVRTWPTEAPWQETYRSGIAVVPAPGDRIPDGVPDPRQPLRAELGGGVAAWVPLSRFVSVSADSATWTPVVVPFDSTFSAEERAVRLASVAIVWNVLQHFYPYFDVVETDWPAALEDALRRAATDDGPIAFEQTLRGLLAAAHDGHGWADLLPYRPFAALPLRASWIEDRLVVTAVDDSIADRVRLGDVILAIDGRAAEARFAELLPFLPGATLPWRRFSGIGQLLGGAPGTGVQLRLRSGGDADSTIRELELVRNRRGWPLDRRPASIDELRPGLAYVDLSRASDDEFQAALPSLGEAHALIFDLRGYPRLDTFGVLSHLTDGTIRPFMNALDEAGRPPRGGAPSVTLPDRADMTFRPDPWTFVIEPATPRLTSNVLFLTNERAISYSETTLSLVQGYGLADIVGSPSAGTNGTNNPFRVPGGYRVTWTGGRAPKQDGSLFHGVGIIPTELVAPTIRGVAQGRDEVLDRAIAIAMERMQASGVR